MRIRLKPSLSVQSLIAAGLVFGLLGIQMSPAQNFVSRNYYGARLEPGSKVLHGAGQSYWDAGVEEYRKALGGQYDPTVVNDYIGVRTAPTGIAEFISKIKGWLAKFPRYTALQLGLPLGGPDIENGPFVDRTQEVANGVYDSNLNFLFAQLQALNIPIYLRIGYECNGSWNPYPIDSYKRAFIRVTNLLRASGLKDSSATVWCISADGSLAYLNWYPGDVYADWWAIDLFRASTFTSGLSTNFLADAHLHRKPVMIAESSPIYNGVLKGQVSWDAWFKPYFDLIHNNAGIKAFNYINWDWSKFSVEYPGGLNCRIGQDPVVTKLYSQEMALPLYLHATTRQGFLDSLKPPGPGNFKIR